MVATGERIGIAVIDDVAVSSRSVVGIGGGSAMSFENGWWVYLPSPVLGATDIDLSAGSPVAVGSNGVYRRSGGSWALAAAVSAQSGGLRVDGTILVGQGATLVAIAGDVAGSIWTEPCGSVPVTFPDGVQTGLALTRKSLVRVVGASVRVLDHIACGERYRILEGIVLPDGSVLQFGSYQDEFPVPPCPTFETTLHAGM